VSGKEGGWGDGETKAGDRDIVRERTQTSEKNREKCIRGGGGKISKGPKSKRIDGPRKASRVRKKRNGRKDCEKKKETSKKIGEKNLCKKLKQPEHRNAKRDKKEKKKKAGGGSWEAGTQQTKSPWASDK